MIAPPRFESLQDYVSHLGDVAFWSPYVAATLQRHGLWDARHEPVAGYNPTWPTFICGDAVVKLFGYHTTWRETFAAERGALALVSADPGIVAPALLGEGSLFDDEAWPYLVTAQAPGEAAWPNRPSDEEWPSIAVELGVQVKRVHALHPSGVAADAQWPDVDVVGAAERSSLPPHLVA